MTFGNNTFRCGNYSREETIHGRKLYKEIRYLIAEFKILAKNQCWTKVEEYGHSFGYGSQSLKPFLFKIYDPIDLATAYGQKPKVVNAKQSARAKGEICTYGPTLPKIYKLVYGLKHYIRDKIVR